MFCIHIHISTNIIHPKFLFIDMKHQNNSCSNFFYDDANTKFLYASFRYFT